MNLNLYIAYVCHVLLNYNYVGTAYKQVLYLPNLTLIDLMNTMEIHKSMSNTCSWYFKFGTGIFKVD